MDHEVGGEVGDDGGVEAARAVEPAEDNARNPIDQENTKDLQARDVGYVESHRQMRSAEKERAK